MSVRTILSLIIAVLLTVLIMQNTEPAKFTLFFADMMIPKLVMLTAASVGGILLGVLIAAPRKLKRPADYDPDDYSDHDEPAYKRRSDTLSDEDRDYIS